MPASRVNATHQGETRPAAPTRQVAETLHDIELRLLRDDPDFVQRMQRLQRANVANAVVVVVLLVASAVLLAIGLATQSAFAWLAGVFAFLAAFPVDGLYRRRCGRAP